MKNELYIFDNSKSRWVDTHVVCGMSLEAGALSALMTPPPLKSTVVNSSRLEHGSRYITERMRYDERPVTIPFHILAKSHADLYGKYAALCDLMAQGEVKIRTAYTGDKVFTLIYQSCAQWSQFNGEMAVFSLKFVEPNPMSR